MTTTNETTLDTILLSEKSEPFNRLLTEAIRVGWPVQYATDLVHDRDTLEKYQPDTFLWVLRDWGTHIVLPQVNLPEMVKAFISMEGEKCKLYVYIEKELREVSRDEAAQWAIANDTPVLVQPPYRYIGVSLPRFFYWYSGLPAEVRSTILYELRNAYDSVLSMFSERTGTAMRFRLCLFSRIGDTKYESYYQFTGDDGYALQNGAVVVSINDGKWVVNMHS